MGFMKPKMPAQDNTLLNQQSAQLAEQKKVEAERAAEATSDVEKRKATAKSKRGRSMLIQTSSTGLRSNLGGTQ